MISNKLKNVLIPLLLVVSVVFATMFAITFITYTTPSPAPTFPEQSNSWGLSPGNYFIIQGSMSMIGDMGLGEAPESLIIKATVLEVNNEVPNITLLVEFWYGEYDEGLDEYVYQWIPIAIVTNPVTEIDLSPAIPMPTAINYRNYETNTQLFNISLNNFVSEFLFEFSELEDFIVIKLNEPVEKITNCLKWMTGYELWYTNETIVEGTYYAVEYLNTLNLNATIEENSYNVEIWFNSLVDTITGLSLYQYMYMRIHIIEEFDEYDFCIAVNFRLLCYNLDADEIPEIPFIPDEVL